jgi:hypothetical protein
LTHLQSFLIFNIYLGLNQNEVPRTSIVEVVAPPKMF